jgi:hypothetical protein
MQRIFCATIACLLLAACDSGDQSDQTGASGRKGGSAPSAATVVVSKGNAFRPLVDDINKAKQLQRQSVQQSQPDPDKQMDQAPAAASNNPPPSDPR